MAPILLRLASYYGAHYFLRDTAWEWVHVTKRKQTVGTQRMVVRFVSGC